MLCAIGKKGSRGKQMRNKDVKLNIRYIQNEDCYDRRYYGAILKHNYLDFLVNGRNGIEENKLKDRYEIRYMLINGKEFHEGKGELKPFANVLRSAQGNIWALEVEIPKKEYRYKLLGNNRSPNAISKAFNKFIEAIELSPKDVSWICSVQYCMDDARLYFFFFENEPTLFNQGTNCYRYRKGRIEYEHLEYFKGELLRGISHLRNTIDYDALNDMYLGLDKIGDAY